MTNQIEDAIIQLIKAHAVTPEIDYTELADRLHDKVCDNVDYDAIMDQVCDSIDIDAEDVARVLDANDTDLTEKLSTMEKRFAEKIAFMDERITGLEAKLAQPQNQPQPQPSTPTQMIERAKNLLADALGMLSNPA